jgi:hypothetical protein
MLNRGVSRYTRSIVNGWVRGGVAIRPWQEHFQSIGLRVLPSLESGLEAGFTPSISCCKKKGKPGSPRDMYVGEKNLRFYRWADEKSTEYVVISDKFGALFPDDVVGSYNLHPSDVTDAMLRDLGRLIGIKCRQRGISKLAFVDVSPWLSTPYLVMLLSTDLDEVAFSTRIR